MADSKKIIYKKQTNAIKIKNNIYSIYNMSDIKKMTNNENVIFYNNDLEQLLAQSAEECESLGILHLASYEKYN